MSLAIPSPCTLGELLIRFKTYCSDRSGEPPLIQKNVPECGVLSVAFFMWKDGRGAYDPSIPKKEGGLLSGIKGLLTIIVSDNLSLLYYKKSDF